MKKLVIFILLSFALFGQEDIRYLNALNLAKSPITQEKAAEKFLELSLEGDTKAMTELGKLYIYGKGGSSTCMCGGGGTGIVCIHIHYVCVCVRTCVRVCV